MLDYGPQTQRLEYALELGGSGVIHNEIFQLTLAHRSQSAVDAWRRTLHSLYEHAGYGTLHTLTDAHLSPLPALAYATLFSDLWTNHLHRRLHSRNAILCNDTLPQTPKRCCTACPDTEATCCASSMPTSGKPPCAG